MQTLPDSSEEPSPAIAPPPKSPLLNAPDGIPILDVPARPQVTEVDENRVCFER